MIYLVYVNGNTLSRDRKFIRLSECPSYLKPIGMNFGTNEFRLRRVFEKLWNLRPHACRTIALPLFDSSISFSDF